MNQIKVLDCTLRDGGYCNGWKFYRENIKKIMDSLSESGIDIIECGFLTSTVDYDEDFTKFTAPGQAAVLVPEKSSSIYVLMVNYGEYDAELLPENDSSIDGIRVAFHKKDLDGALDMCKKIKDKNYKVFIQPMLSLSYTDSEFLVLLEKVNELMPFAFYIVDSFGMMKEKDLMRLFYMVENNLDRNIQIGFHSHNNMQLAFSNAQTLAGIHTDRNLIVDASVYGMGRGAGNLNTELAVGYLNDSFGHGYKLKPLLNVIDSILGRFFEEKRWGYSLPNYLSAKYNIHPNYASYLAERQTLTVENMDDIFSMMDEEQKAAYNREYIEKIYNLYMESGHAQEEHMNEVIMKLRNETVLVIAPGRSLIEESDKILAYCSRKNPVVISIHFEYSRLESDFIFSSNIRRFRELDKKYYGKCIATSNISDAGVYLKVRYQELECPCEAVRDNAGMMLLRFLINAGVRKIGIAGMDGYSADAADNYADQKMKFYADRAAAEARNAGMSEMLMAYGEEADIEFVTRPKHITYDGMWRTEEIEQI